MRFRDAKCPGFRLSYWFSKSVERRIGLYTARGLKKCLSIRFSSVSVRTSNSSFSYTPLFVSGSVEALASPGV